MWFWGKNWNYLWKLDYVCVKNKKSQLTNTRVKLLYLHNTQCLVFMNVDPSVNVTLKNTKLLKAWTVIWHLCATSHSENYLAAKYEMCFYSSQKSNVATNGKFYSLVWSILKFCATEKPLPIVSEGTTKEKIINARKGLSISETK